MPKPKPSKDRDAKPWISVVLVDPAIGLLVSKKGRPVHLDFAKDSRAARMRAGSREIPDYPEVTGMTFSMCKTDLFLLTYVALFLGFSLLAQCSSSEPISTQQPDQVMVDMQERSGENMSKSKSNPKLSFRMNQMLEAYRVGGMSEARIYAVNHNMVLQDDRIQVTIVTSEGTKGDVRKAVEALGGEYQLHYKNLMQAILPISALEAMAKRPDVKVIREPRRAFKP